MNDIKKPIPLSSVPVAVRAVVELHMNGWSGNQMNDALAALAVAVLTEEKWRRDVVSAWDKLTKHTEYREGVSYSFPPDHADMEIAISNFRLDDDPHPIFPNLHGQEN